MKNFALCFMPLLLIGSVACSAPPNSEGFSGPIRDCTVYAADLTGRDGEEVSGEKRMVEKYEYNERGLMIRQYFEGQTTIITYNDNNKIMSMINTFDDMPTKLLREMEYDENGDFLKESLVVDDESGSGRIKTFTKLEDGSGGYEFVLHDPDTGEEVGHGKANAMGKTTEIVHERGGESFTKITMSYNGTLLSQWSSTSTHSDPAQNTVETETYNDRGDLVWSTKKDGTGKLLREEVRTFSDFDGHGNWRRCIATISENGTESRVLRTRELYYY